MTRGIRRIIMAENADNEFKYQSRVPGSVRSRLKLQFAIHRLFTYPKEFYWLTGFKPHEMAKSGLYCDPDFKTVKCHFCVFKCNLNHNTDHDIKQHLECSNKGDRDVSFTENFNYGYEAHRLYSLLLNEEHLPNFIHPYDVAHTGMYYVGPSDTCKCNFCHLTVSEWENGDTPSGEHRRFNQDCIIFQNRSYCTNINIGQEDVNTQYDFLRIENTENTMLRS